MIDANGSGGRVVGEQRSHGQHGVDDLVEALGLHHGLGCRQGLRGDVVGGVDLRVLRRRAVEGDGLMTSTTTVVDPPVGPVEDGARRDRRRCRAARARVRAPRPAPAADIAPWPPCDWPIDNQRSPAPAASRLRAARTASMTLWPSLGARGTDVARRRTEADVVGDHVDALDAEAGCSAVAPARRARRPEPVVPLAQETTGQPSSGASPSGR